MRCKKSQGEKKRLIFLTRLPSILFLMFQSFQRSMWVPRKFGIFFREQRKTKVKRFVQIEKKIT